MKLSRKQTEIRDRERRILQLARPMVAEHGLSGLSMDAIAREMDYAKGTIYNHFACKEEILLALAIQANAKRLELFSAAAEGQSASRDQISAIGVACEEFRTRFSDLFEIDCLVRHAAVWEKASEQRRETLAVCEQRCMTLLSEIGRRAIETGELTLPARTGVEELVFGLWSLTYGGMVIDLSSPGLEQIGIRNCLSAIRKNCHALMDGFGWQPLYDADRDRRFVRQVRQQLRRRVSGELAAASLDAAVDLTSGAGVSK